MRLVLAILAGLTLYLGLHLGVLRKPLTIGYIRAAYDHKLDYARRLDPSRPKVVVVGGSSSLYSVRCQTITAETGLPCVNMAVTAGIGVDLVLAKAEPVIQPGDIVLLPLEYDFYWAEADGLDGNSLANTYAVTYDRTLLAGFGWHRRAAALLSLSFQDIYGSAVEMALAAKGIQRRFSVSQLTPQGDMSGHGAALAVQYVGYLAGLRGAEPMPDGKREDEGWRLVTAFIERQHARGVCIFGTFPATIDDGAADPAGYETVRRLWREAGVGFLDLPNLGRYPRAAFFDTHYHLAEPIQIDHSLLLAKLLRERLD